MEPIKVLIYGIDDIYPQLKPYYEREVKAGNMQIEGYAINVGGGIKFYKNLDKEPLTSLVKVQKIIISSSHNFMPMMKNFMSMNNQMIMSDFIDGRIFQINDFNFLKFINEGVAYGKITNHFVVDKFVDNYYSIYPRIYEGNHFIKIGKKSYIENAMLEGYGKIQIGNFTSISWKIIFELGLSLNHDYNNIFSYDMSHFDWQTTNKLTINTINIGSDVWIGRGCILKAANSKKPLNIGNGAVIASDSVVVKDVPPYAIVGGNPAKIIKYRFNQETIEALERIAWWNWDLEKIYDNFHLFNNIPEFVRKFDPQY